MGPDDHTRKTNEAPYIGYHRKGDWETQENATVIFPTEWLDQVIHPFIAKCAKPILLDFFSNFQGKLVVISKRLFQRSSQLRRKKRTAVLNEIGGKYATHHHWPRAATLPPADYQAATLTER